MAAGQFATDFDGSSDYYSRASGLVGSADSKTGIFSCWSRLDGGDGTTRTFYGNTSNRFYVIMNGNNLNVFGTNSAGATRLNVITDTTYLAGSVWHHVLVSWNMATPECAFAVDDAIVAQTETSLIDASIDYTRNSWSIGAVTDGTLKFDGALAEFYLALGEYLDPAIEANRRKFISAAGKPVPLGPDGSTPTGTAAIIYAPDGNPAVNQGTGGNFVEQGSPVRIAGPGRRASQAALISGV